MKRSVAHVLVALAVLSAGSRCSAVSHLLFFDPGARAAGMGGCFVSVADDASAVSWNPGGLPFMAHRLSAVTGYGSVVPQYDGFSYRYLAVAGRSERLGALAAGLTYLAWPEQIAAGHPDDPDPFVSFTPDELSWSLSYAYPLFDRLGVGATVKRLRFEMAPDEFVVDGHGTAAAWLYDVGLLLRQPVSMGESTGVLRFGASLLHFGSDLRVEGDDGDRDTPLPQRAKAGASIQLGGSGRIGGTGCVEVTWPIEQYETIAIDEEHPQIGVGGEFSIALGSADPDSDGSDAYPGRLTLRLGYMRDDDREVSGLTVGGGTGFRVGQAHLALDYARVPGDWDNPSPWWVSGSIGVGF